MSYEKTIIDSALKKAVELQQSGLLNQAEEIYRNLLAKFPDTADAYNLLGAIYLERGKVQQAITLIKKALSYNKKNAIYLNNLGNALRDNGEGREAEKMFRKALKSNPKNVSARNNLGNCLSSSGNMTSAISTFKKALEIAPDFHSARLNLANAYFKKGENDQAVKYYRQILDEAPHYSKAARNLAEAKKFTTKDQDFARLKSLSESTEASAADRANILFAYAKALNDLKEYSDAFKVFSKANKSFRATYEYKVEDDQKFMQEIRDIFTRDFLMQFRTTGPSKIQPVFVVGMPRSGTSLVEQILSSHSKVFGAGELYFMEEIVFSDIRQKGARTFTQAFSSEPEATVDTAAQQYLSKLRHLPTKKTRIVDKMPRNFLYVGLIKSMIPNAKIIHCCRSAEDTCLSIFTRHFTGQQNFAYDLEELGKFYNLYLEHMDYWRNLFPQEIYDIDYEKLVKNQESETRKLLEFCELDWEKACLDFHTTKRVVQTASIEQVRKPIYSSSLQAWKKFEAELEPLIGVLRK